MASPPTFESQGSTLAERPPRFVDVLMNCRLHVVLASVALLLLAGWAFRADMLVARHVRVLPIPGLVEECLAMAEWYGHGLGVLLTVVMVYCLDAGRRRTIPRVLVGAYGAGLAADVIKLMVARTRPRAADLATEVWATFDGWFPFGTGGSNLQSFPSAHTATAVGLTVVLWRLFPRTSARVFFVVMTLLVACQRIESSAHYPSDVLAGAAVGLSAAWFLTVDPAGAVTRWLDRLERRSPDESEAH